MKKQQNGGQSPLISDEEIGFHQEHQRQETNPEGFILEIGNKVAKRQQQEPTKKAPYTKKSLSPQRNLIADSNVRSCA